MGCKRSNVTVDSPELTATSGEWWITVDGHDRWMIYYRLQSLGITCHCQSGAPLKVQINSPQDLIQYWSVVRCAVFRRGDRATLATVLKNCLALDVNS